MAIPMKFNKTTAAILFALIYICSTNVFAQEYKTKSIFSDDYKCVADEQGGFNHNAYGHDLVRFKDKAEFFLIHISNIPYEAIIDLNTQMKVDSNDPSKLREEFENRIMKQEIIPETAIIEKSSYFIREPENDPKEMMIYVHNGCTSYKIQENGSIVCYEADNSKTFSINLKTMRFTYSYAGSWGGTQENGYYGDSSVFAFGTCKKYYH